MTVWLQGSPSMLQGLRAACHPCRQQPAYRRAATDTVTRLVSRPPPAESIAGTTCLAGPPASDQQLAGQRAVHALVVGWPAQDQRGSEHERRQVMLPMLATRELIVTDGRGRRQAGLRRRSWEVYRCRVDGSHPRRNCGTHVGCGDRARPSRQKVGLPRRHRRALGVYGQPCVMHGGTQMTAPEL